MLRTTSLALSASIAAIIPCIGGGGAKALDATPSQATTDSLGITASPIFVAGLPFGGWLLYPSVNLGSVYNSNINSEAHHPQSSVGVQIQPRLDAAYDDGIHNIALYANGDFQLYPSRQDDSRITARVGGTWTYSPFQDLSVELHGDYSRSNGMFMPGFWSAPTQTWQAPSTALTDSSVFTDTYEASVAVEKKLTDQSSVRLSGGIVYANFDRPDDKGSTNSATPLPLNGVDYYAALRATTKLTPQVYGFVEGGVDIHRYDSHAQGDSVYHLTAGLGSELIRLVRGEIYVGYQTLIGSGRQANNTSQPAFGGKISYYPTEYITISASADQSLSFYQTPTLLQMAGGGPSFFMQPSSGKTFQSRLQADYALSQLWTAYVQGGYGQTQYSVTSSLNRTQVWSAGAGVRYDLLRNMALTLEYQFNKSDSTYKKEAQLDSASSFDQSIISIGLTYHY